MICLFKRDSKYVVGQSSLRELYHNMPHIQKDFRNANLYCLLINNLKGLSVFDIGCGPGHLLYLSHKKGYEVCGIEPDRQLIELGEKLYPGANLRIKCKPAESLNCDKRFDNITTVDVLEHIRYEKDLLIKLRDNLNQKGQLIIVVPAHPILFGIRDRAMGHYRRYTKRRLVELVESCGYKSLKVRHWNAFGFIPYFISEKILRKPLNISFRDQKEKTGSKSFLARFLFFWFKFVENKYDFHFGLSLILFADSAVEKKSL